MSWMAIPWEPAPATTWAAGKYKRHMISINIKFQYSILKPAKLSENKILKRSEMKKINSQGWKRQSESIKRIAFAIILALIVLLAVGCRGRHWGGGHDDDGYDRGGEHGCSSQFVESFVDIF